MSLEIHPVTADRWDDLTTLFGPNGAYSNCWCTWWILTGKVYGETDPQGRRSLLQTMVSSDEEPGLLAYRDGAPVGWCAVGPRLRYTRLMSNRSQVYRPPDDAIDNWVINCFYLPRAERRQGIATELLDAAVDYAFGRGAASIDGYPLIHTDRGPNSLYVGTVSMFERAGFVEIRRVSERPLMRLSRSQRSSS
jgi:GNAT superfamily N-acetyltransferase